MALDLAIQLTNVADNRTAKPLLAIIENTVSEPLKQMYNIIRYTYFFLLFWRVTSEINVSALTGVVVVSVVYLP